MAICVVNKGDYSVRRVLLQDLGATFLTHDIFKRMGHEDMHAGLPWGENQHPANPAVAYEDRLAALPEEVAASVRNYAADPDMPANYQERYFRLLDLAHGLDVDPTEDEYAMLSLLAGTDNLEWAQQQVESWGFRRLIRQDVSDHVLEEMEAARNGFRHLGATTLRRAPGMAHIFQTIGIPEPMARQLYSAWNTYSAQEVAASVVRDQRRLRPGHDIPSAELTDEQWQIGINSKVSRMTGKLDALRDYVREYGLEETLLLHDTFHIRNFSRLKPETLHRQLERWKAGVSIKNLVATSTADYQDGLEGTVKDVFKVLPEEETFWFEFNDKRELAGTMVTAGKFERQHGREPDVANVIIAGHGNPESIEAGPHEKLRVSDYVQAAHGRANIGLIGNKANKHDVQINDYHRHLGSNYRVILAACNVASVSSEGQNITNTLSRDHRATTVGAPGLVLGIVEITPDGVVYNHGENLKGLAYRPEVQVS